MRIYNNHGKQDEPLNPSPLRNGAMSVEAVFILPLVLFSLFLILFFSFYIHQRVWFTEAAYESVLSPGKEEEKANLLLEEAPLTLSNLAVHVRQTKDYVEITYEVELIPNMRLLNLNFKTKADARILKPVEHIRKVRLIQKLT
ncbi:MAG TPA: pilus assembly protein [Candidatus Pelethocola excrementipullorum]|nr:pilus assembly protein [Candidatus Pelethocola excrementipullorum]